MAETHSNLTSVTEFLNAQSASGDVGRALMDTTIAFKIVIWLIMVVGAVAMAIWIGRIAIDIILIVTRGFGEGEGSKWYTNMQKMGTAAGGDYTSVKAYLSKNLLEIILVMILIALLMTGYLIRIIAFGISGVGVLLNKLLGLDIGGKYTALDAEAFAEQAKVQRASTLRNQYDQQYALVAQYSSQLYDMAKDSTIGDDPVFNQTKSYYTQAMVKANILSGELTKRKGVINEMKLGEGYFKKHLRESGEQVCNEQFLVRDVINSFKVGGADTNIKCTK